MDAMLYTYCYLKPDKTLKSQCLTSHASYVMWFFNSVPATTFLCLLLNSNQIEEQCQPFWELLT